jgi:hypothetical protein
MHVQPSYSPEQIDAAVLDLLTDGPELWAVSEVEREMADPVATKDSLDRLVGGGLVHRLDCGFVQATRPARIARELCQ